MYISIAHHACVKMKINNGQNINYFTFMSQFGNIVQKASIFAFSAEGGKWVDNIWIRFIGFEICYSKFGTIISAHRIVLLLDNISSKLCTPLSEKVPGSYFSLLFSNQEIFQLFKGQQKVKLWTLTIRFSFSTFSKERHTKLTKTTQMWQKHCFILTLTYVR